MILLLLAVLGKIKGVLMEDSAVFEEVLESLEVTLNDVHQVMKLKSRSWKEDFMVTE